MGFCRTLTKAIDGTRTRGFHLGKVALYQLSHYRMNTLCHLQFISIKHLSLPVKQKFWKVFDSRYFERCLMQQIFSKMLASRYLNSVFHEI